MKEKCQNCTCSSKCKNLSPKRKAESQSESEPKTKKTKTTQWHSFLKFMKISKFFQNIPNNFFLTSDWRFFFRQYSNDIYWWQFHVCFRSFDFLRIANFFSHPNFPSKISVTGTRLTKHQKKKGRQRLIERSIKTVFKSLGSGFFLENGET